jgi:cellulose synthase (UDP-forming)
VNTYYPIFFVLIAALGTAAHCLWLRHLGLVTAPDYASRSRYTWPLYGATLCWLGFLCLDVAYAQRLFLAEHRLPLAELLWAYVLAGGVAILHLHTGLFLLDARRALRADPLESPQMVDLLHGPEVAILIPSCNEPSSVIRETLRGATQQTYRSTRVILVENSSDGETKLASIRVAEETPAEVMNLPCLGSKAAALNRALEEIEAPFVGVLDADQVPDPQFVAEVLPHLQADSRVAFVQTPQSYRNTGGSVIALAAAAQQHPFYQYLLPGRSELNGMYCVGTNVIFNADHLREVGGFDDRTVTEDIATSFLLHRAGYRSVFIPNYLVKGLGPMDFTSYLVQQRRWAKGTVQLLKSLLNHWLGFAAGLRLFQWTRYVGGALYYLTGLATVAFLVSPIVASLGLDQDGLVRLSENPILMTLPLRLLFYAYLTLITIGLETRTARWLWLGGMLTVSATIAFINGALGALLSKRSVFEVTPKLNASRSRLSDATLLCLFCLWVGNLTAGASRSTLLSASGAKMGCVVLLVWTFINCISVSGVFVFGLSRRGRKESRTKGK